MDSTDAAAARPIRAILLDVDGTLLASNDAHAAAWSDACAEFGYERDAAFFRPLIGMGGDRVLPLVADGLDDERGTGKALAERRKAIYTERYFPRVEPTPGARALVRRFHDEGWRCVIATSATQEELAASLERIGIAELIDCAAKSGDARESKPAPDIVEAALDKAGLAPRDALMLGDTPYDVQAATAAGVRVVVVLSGGWDAAALAGAAATYDDPQDMLERFDFTR